MTEEIINKIEEDVNSCSKSNQKRRKEGLINYYSNPNICKYCGEIIKVPFKGKLRETTIKQFCDRSCATSFNNSKKPKREKQEKKLLERIYINENLSKKELFDKFSNWQNARSAIVKNAKKNYEKSNKLKQCNKCGYTKHYEICHIKSVSSFDDETLISEINHIDNLIALCPNCHWELDNKLFDIK